MIPTLSYLRNNCKRIYYFGIGFIQVCVSDRIRYHFYTRKLGATSLNEEPHTHRYSFNSEILQGIISNTMWVEVGSEGILLEEKHGQCRKGEPLTITRKVRLTPTDPITYTPGCVYSISTNDVHTVSAIDGTITRITRGDYTCSTAKVYTQVGHTDICPFNYTYEERTLWEEVSNVISNKL